MMKDIVFCDTNVLIRLLSGDLLVTSLLTDKRAWISIITEMEMQCKADLTDEQAMIIRELLNACTIIGLTDSIKDRAIGIRRSTKLKLMDAIVAASAVELGLPLLTSDEMFSRVVDGTVVLIPASNK